MSTPCSLTDPSTLDALAEAIAERLFQKMSAAGWTAPVADATTVLNEPDRMRDLVGLVMSSLTTPGDAARVKNTALNAQARLTRHSESLGPRKGRR